MIGAWLVDSAELISRYTRLRQRSAIVSSRNNACLILSQVTARRFGSNSIKVESTNPESVESCATAGPRTTNWPLLLFTVRMLSDSAAETADAISELRRIARVLIILCGGVPDNAGLESTPGYLPSDFGLAAFDSAGGAGFGSAFGAGFASALLGGVAGADSFLAASL